MKHPTGCSNHRHFPGLIRVPLQLLLWALIPMAFAQYAGARCDDMSLPRTELTETAILQASPDAHAGQPVLAGGASTAHGPGAPCAGHTGHPCAAHGPGAPCAGHTGHPCAAHGPGAPCAGHTGYPCNS